MLYQNCNPNGQKRASLGSKFTKPKHLLLGLRGDQRFEDGFFVFLLFTISFDRLFVIPPLFAFDLFFPERETFFKKVLIFLQ